MDLSSSEIYEDGEFKAGPEMPVTVYSHCMVRLNETHSLLTGGATNLDQVSIFHNHQVILSLYSVCHF